MRPKEWINLFPGSSKRSLSLRRGKRGFQKSGVQVSVCEGTGAGSHRPKTFAPSTSPQHSPCHSPLRAPVPPGRRRRRASGGPLRQNPRGAGDEAWRSRPPAPSDGRPHPGRLSFSSTWTDPPTAPAAESGARRGPRRGRACAEGAPRSPRELVNYRVRERTRPRLPWRRRRRRRGGPPGTETTPPTPIPTPHLELKTLVGLGSPFSAGETVSRAQRAVTLSLFHETRLCAWEGHGRGSSTSGAGRVQIARPPSSLKALGAPGLLGPARPSARIQSQPCNNHNSSSHHLLSSEGLPGPSAKCITHIIPLNSRSNPMKEVLL